MTPKNPDETEAETPKAQSPPQRERGQEKKPESSNSPRDKGEDKAEEKPKNEQKPEPPKRKRRIAFNEPYVPKGKRQQLEEQPGARTGYLAEMERKAENATRTIYKGYDEIEPGVFVLGPCRGMTVFSERVGTSKATQNHNYKLDGLDREFHLTDGKHHPLIVIGKNIDGSLQTVMCTTFGIEDGGKLEDRTFPSLDATACKYYVPMDGRPHEDNYEDKGQPGFTIKFTKGPFIALSGEKDAGWASSFMYFNLYPTVKHNTFHVTEEVSITPESLRDLQREIDKNEPERIKFIDKNEDLFRDPKNGGFSSRKIDMLKSRKAYLRESKATPPSGSIGKAGPLADARSSRDARNPIHGASGQTSHARDSRGQSHGTGGSGGQRYESSQARQRRLGDNSHEARERTSWTRR